MFKIILENLLCTLYYEIRSNNHIDKENNGQKSISLTKKLDFFYL